MASSNHEPNGHAEHQGKKQAKTRSSPRPVSITSNLSKNSICRDSITSTISSPSRSVKPQSWSETHAESSINNRLKVKEKLKPANISSTSKLRQQRERRRTKRREPYMPSTEGTSTGEEDGELFQMEHVKNVDTVDLGDKSSRHRCSLHHQADSKYQSPSYSARRFSSPTVRRMSKSPSDLDADDEDNQDYDSASIISASESQARMTAIQNSTLSNEAIFNAQFQEIRVAGMRQLADIDANTGLNGVRNSLLEAANSHFGEQIGKMLEEEKREKLTLIQELGQKEQRIYEMEKALLDLNRRLLDTGIENEHLRAENRTLLQAMAKLSAAE